MVTGIVSAVDDFQGFHFSVAMWLTDDVLEASLYICKQHMDLYSNFDKRWKWGYQSYWSHNTAGDRVDEHFQIIIAQKLCGE